MQAAQPGHGDVGRESTRDDQINYGDRGKPSDEMDATPQPQATANHSLALILRNIGSGVNSSTFQIVSYSLLALTKYEVCSSYSLKKGGRHFIVAT